MSATKQYRTTQPCYRDGVYHQAGVVLTVPADEKPSRTWTLLDERAADEKPAPKSEPKSKGRASDSSPI